MKKFKKILLSTVLAAVTFAVAVFPTACSNKENIVRDSKTINIRSVIGGYGDSWLKALANKFNEAYAEEGYKANVLASSPTLDDKEAMKKLYSKDEWADIYFVTVNNTMADFVSKENGGRGEYGHLVADLTDTVWSKPAINFKGEEESTTPISEKARIKLPDDVLKVNGKVYGINTSNDIGGMIVNTEKLKTYGVNEIPKTTKEFFEVFELIYLGDSSKGIAGSEASGIYPITYLGGDNGYPLHFFTAWQAQYAGIEEYNQFYGYVDKDGNELKDDGYKVYDSKALDETVAAMYQMFDMSFIARGSNNNTIDTAHTKIMHESKGAIFMADGNWAYNEVITNYPDKIDNLAFANIPVLSAVGTKLFSKYGFDADKCEEILSYIIGKADEGKTSAEILATIKAEKDWAEGNDATFEGDIVEVMKARGVYCSRSSLAAGALVADKSQSKELCYLFLRMFASDDNAVLYNQECNGFTAYMSDFSQAKDTTYNQQCQAIVENSYATPVWMNSTDLRLKMGHNNKIFGNTDLSFVNEIISKEVTIYNSGSKVGDASAYASNAKTFMDGVRNSVSSNWAKWIQDAKL